MAEANGRHEENWKRQRRTGVRAILLSGAVALPLWLAIRFLAPPVPGTETLLGRMIFALQCLAFATLFCLVMGIEAVAHERLQSDAFDPLAGHVTRRMQVNQRYLQNTLEQWAVFAPGLLGLAYYSPGPDAMRSVEATAAVWILTRLAFWIGYHRSAAMRGLGAPGMALGMIALLYVCVRAASDWWGSAGAILTVIAFLAFEGLLFGATRSGRF